MAALPSPGVVLAKYKEDCERSKCAPLASVLKPLESADIAGDSSVETFTLIGERVDAAAGACLARVCRLCHTQKLVLSRCTLVPTPAAVIAALSEAIARDDAPVGDPTLLGSLELTETGLDAAGWEQLGVALAQPSCRLSSLLIDSCGLRAAAKVVNKMGGSVMSLVTGSARLVSLTTSGTDVPALTRCLEQMHGVLHELRVARSGLTPLTLLPCLGRLLVPLQVLDLRGNSALGDDGVVALCDALSSRDTGECHLSSLDLWGCRVGQRSCERLCALLDDPACALRRLNIGGNGATLSDRAFMSLQPALVRRSCPLRRLGIAANNLGEDSAIGVAEALATGGTLLRVDMRDNGVGPAGLMALVASLRQNRQCQAVLVASSQVLGDAADGPLCSALCEDLDALCLRNRMQRAAVKKVRADNPELLEEHREQLQLQRDRADKPVSSSSSGNIAADVDGSGGGGGGDVDASPSLEDIARAIPTSAGAFSIDDDEEETVQTRLEYDEDIPDSAEDEARQRQEAWEDELERELADVDLDVSDVPAIALGNVDDLEADFEDLLTS